MKQAKRVAADRRRTEMSRLKNRKRKRKEETRRIHELAAHDRLHFLSALHRQEKIPVSMGQTMIYDAFGFAGWGAFVNFQISRWPDIRLSSITGPYMVPLLKAMGAKHRKHHDE